MKYFRPSTVNELEKLLSDKLILNSKQFLSGGTDILPRWENGVSPPKHLIDLKKVERLSGISKEGNNISIGTLTTIQQLKDNPNISKHFPSIIQATSSFAGVQIRHRATIGGNICNASPAGDLIPCLYVHNAKVELLSPRGVRIIPVDEFFIGPGKTTLQKDEFLTKIILPISNIKSMFYKLGLRQSMAISVVNFALSYDLNPDNTLKSLNIACGAVAPTVVYLKYLVNAIINGESVESVIDLIYKDISPIDDIRASAEYRRKALKNLIAYTINNLKNSDNPLINHDKDSHV